MIKVFLTFISFYVLSGCALAQSGSPPPLDRAIVIEAVADHLETNYVEAESTGSSAARQLRTDWSTGLFISARHGEAFAAMLSERMQALTGDGHLNVEYFAEPIGENEEAKSDFDQAQMERWYGAQVNYGVYSVQRLDGNVGYLDLRVFAPIDMGGDTVAAAMTVIADMDALIIDLRKNGGGIGDAANLVASYLFGPERQPLTGVYDRPTDTLTQNFTQPHISGKRFGPDKPVYILISPKTFSAAEALAYDLRALERAVIVGEPSGGGAHPFEYVRINTHFVLWSVTAKSVNPFTLENWQTVGVQPDILINSEDALERALEEIRN
ncbi:MAG: S41 family peptidase [Pseudomonadota bacterium]